MRTHRENDRQSQRLTEIQIKEVLCLIVEIAGPNHRKAIEEDQQPELPKYRQVVR